MSDRQRDIEESDEVLDAPDQDPVDFWIKKQRELVTSVVDYNLSTLAELMENNTINRSPTYQRRFRWDEARQSRLIESFLMNIPVPPIFLNEDEYGRYSVIDGQQRLSAIFEFLRGRLLLTGLKTFSELNGSSFDHIPGFLQRVLQTRPTLRAVIILRHSDEDVKFEVPQRLNTGGMALNPQEIRNSTFPGPLNDLILSLSTDRRFHRLLGIRKPESSYIYKHMRDAELVLRFLTYRKSWQGFAGGMKRNLGRYMAENRRPSDQDLVDAREDFLETISVVEACFGEYAFRRWTPESQQWRKQVVAALYDAEMIACYGLLNSIADVEPKREEFVRGLRELMETEAFRRSIDAATNAPAAFRARIEMMQGMLKRVLESD